MAMTGKGSESRRGLAGGQRPQDIMWPDGVEQFEPNPHHYEAAANWLIWLRQANLRTDPQFEHWKHEHPAHEFAFAEVEAMFEASDRPARDAERGGREQMVVVNKPAYRRYFPHALAASLLLAVSMPAANWVRLIGVDEITRAGEMRKVRLGDGSLVTLNTRTAFDTDGSVRNTHLLEGEAYFEVVHDPSHPFTVRTGNALVQVLGTKFNVRTDGDQSVISVSQGRVRVSRADRPQASIDLSVGEEALVRSGDLIKRPSTPAVEAAWRQGKIVFQSTPLRVVVAELNRYRSASAYILDSKLGERIVTGVFRTNDPDGTIRIIDQTLGTRSVTLPTGQTFLY